MKKQLTHILVSAMVILLPAIMTGCSSGKDKNVDSATVEEDTLPALPEEDASRAVITNLGIGPVKCRQLVSSVQPSVVNLYDSIAIERGYEATIYHFMRDGRTRFDGYEFGDGQISVVSVADNSVVAETPQGEISLGVPFSRVLALKGVEPQFQALDGEGMWCWIWQGLYFQPSQQNLPQRLSSRLYNAGTTPSASDFDENVTVDYIGTGMPY